MYKWDTEKYFSDLSEGVGREYEVAGLAREKGLDPVSKVEIPLAMTMAEKCVALISTAYPKLPVEKITARILELENKYGQLDAAVSFVIAREIAEEKFCKFKDRMEAIDAGIRTGFAYMTLGVVSCPIEGYTGLKLGKTKDDKEYFVASFSGPIRAAGTTSICMSLMLIDYLREHFGFAKYDPDENEVKRYVQENTDYHERVTNLQYFPTEEEMEFLAERLPFQIDGDPTERIEVSNYKDLKRVRDNMVRGGMCLTFSEGLAQKAGKAWGRLRSCKNNGLKCSGFDWIPEYLELHKKRESGGEDTTATYIKDLVAGRPVYGHPSRSGGFRFRYGKGRTAGFSAVSIHPATMGVSNGFLSNGTQLKLEKPTKGCIITSCDSIDGPIIKLNDGSVKKLDNYQEARELYERIDEIVYLGDILFPLGDVMDRNADLVKPGYVEEIWEAEVDVLGIQNSEFRIIPQKAKESADPLSSCGNFIKGEIDLDEAIEISRKYGVSLHPGFIFYWTQISNEDFVELVKWLNVAVWRGGKLVLPWEKSVREKFGIAKRALEILGVEHTIVLDNIVIDKDARSFLINLGKGEMHNGEVLGLKVNEVDDRSVLEIVNSMCEFEIRDKAGSFIGARMGRPEKAKLRALTGSPNMLFPVGDQGGRLRSVQDAIETGFVKADAPVFKCECGNESVYEKCEKCGAVGKKAFYCRQCKEVKSACCKLHDSCFEFYNRKIDVKSYFDSAIKTLEYEAHEVPPMIKGIRRMSSECRTPENLAKGVLRSKYNLSVNKDGTIRYDATEIPLTHFKPKEIRVGVEQLKELGYDKDIDGKDLVNENQILELKPHDVILPSCPVTNDQKADDVFFNIANFVDEELERLYGLPRHYNLKSKDDLVGRLVVCMAPHNCAGVVGRIIGWTHIQGLIASPYMHAAMRRDCDGDEAAVMMLMDVLMNFSRKFLPSHRGGSQDAPLVLNARIRAGEVDDQILFLDTSEKYSLEFYKIASEGRHSSEVKEMLVRDKLKSGEEEPFVGAGFTHDTSDMNLGVVNGAYKTLPTMKEKVAAQMELVGKIRAVDEDDVARLVLERHFIRDIRGNLRKFAWQGFRCSKCNEKYRRPPLKGSCLKCEGKIVFTISEGSVRKYLEPAMDLMSKYNISSYTKEGMELTQEYIESIFGKGDKQETL